VAVIALGLVLLSTQPTILGSPFPIFGGSSGGERDVSVDRQSVTAMSLEINGGAGRFRVVGGSATLVEAHSASADLRLRRSDLGPQTSSTHADVRIDQIGNKRVGGTTTDVETRIASDVPTELSINGGAGEFFIDLSDVKVTSAELNVGAASLTLTLPKPTGTVNVDVNAGASSIVIEVPEGVEARVTTTGLVLTLRSSNPRVTASGNSAETSGYGSATARVTVHVTAGASSIAIR